MAFEEPWRACFELAWESFHDGTFPIGAVVTDETGAIVSRGRNMIFSKERRIGQLAGSFVAHAEIDALAGVTGGLSRHALYTSMEPCLMCAGAARLAMVGVVRFAASDPLWAGNKKLVDLSATVARHWPNYEGPFPGPLELVQPVANDVLHAGTGGRVHVLRDGRVSTASS